MKRQADHPGASVELRTGTLPSIAETSPETVGEEAGPLSRERAQADPQGRGGLEAAGHVTGKGTRYGAAAIARMIAR